MNKIIIKNDKVYIYSKWDLCKIMLALVSSKYGRRKHLPYTVLLSSDETGQVYQQPRYTCPVKSKDNRKLAKRLSYLYTITKYELNWQKRKELFIKYIKKDNQIPKSLKEDLILLHDLLKKYDLTQYTLFDFHKYNFAEDNQNNLILLDPIWEAKKAPFAFKTKILKELTKEV